MTRRMDRTRGSLILLPNRKFMNICWTRRPKEFIYKNKLGVVHVDIRIFYFRKFELSFLTQYLPLWHRRTMLPLLHFDISHPRLHLHRYQVKNHPILRLHHQQHRFCLRFSHLTKVPHANGWEMTIDSASISKTITLMAKMCILPAVSAEGGNM